MEVLGVSFTCIYSVTYNHFVLVEGRIYKIGKFVVIQYQPNHYPLVVSKFKRDSSNMFIA